MKLTDYTKSIAALLGAVGTWGMTAAAQGGIDGPEWFGLVVALGTVLAVFGLKNTESPPEA